MTVGIAGAFVSAYAYSFGLLHIPEAHLAAFATMAFGALAGAAAGFGLVWGHVRNKTAALAVGAISSAVALYLSWAMWIEAVLERDADNGITWARLARHPRGVWYMMKLINRYGTWTFDNGKTPTTGWQLWVVWAIEAALVIGIGIAVTIFVQRLHPYCETCGQWCRRTARLYLAPVADVLQLKGQVEAKNLQALEGLGPGSKRGDHTHIELDSCSTCGQFHTLSVGQVTVRRKKFGQPQVASQKLVRQMIVGAEEAQRIRQLSEKLAVAPNVSARGAASGRG
jgi:hypothetical protein